MQVPALYKNDSETIFTLYISKKYTDIKRD